MPIDAPIVWVGGAAPTPPEEAAASAWAKARSIAIVSTAPAARDDREDRAAASRVEEALRRAREAVIAGSAEAAEGELSRAEGELRAHPWLPESPWLGAEVARAWAHRWARLEPRDVERAKLAWGRAASIDGGRIAALGEADKATVEASVTPVTASLRVRGADASSAIVMLDGSAVAPGEVRSAEGEHHVRVLVDGETVFAAWVPFVEGARIDVPLAGLDPCRPAALARARWDGIGAVAAATVTCTRWVAAARDRAGRLHFADCTGSSCTVTERAPVARRARERFSAAERAATPFRMPTWVTWTLAGTGVIAAGTLALVASGALEARPVETRFVHDGVRTQ